MNIQLALQIARENGAIIYLILIGIGLVWMWERKCKEVKELKEENKDLRYLQHNRKVEEDCSMD
jgi:hypothetical protein